MKRNCIFVLFALILASLACENGTPTPQYTPPTPPAQAEHIPSSFDLGNTAYGFFPSPPEATLESVLNHF